MTAKLRADFDERYVVEPSEYEWVDSPMPGVERMMLDRIGDEVARAVELAEILPFTATLLRASSVASLSLCNLERRMSDPDSK